MFPWERYKCRSPTLKPSLTLSDRLRNVLSRDSLDDFWAVLQAGVDINTRDWCDRTPLHLVIEWKKDLEIVKAVLSAGADPNAIDRKGNTPLHAAINSYSSPAIIEVLLTAGADIEQPDWTGRSPLMKSINDYNNVSVIGVLLSAGANVRINNLMAEAVKNKTDPEVIKFFIKGGASVNYSSTVFPPISYAVKNSDREVVKLLLEAGATTEFLYPQTQCTLLHDVKVPGVAKELIRHGMDVNAEDIKGSTPLHYAVMNNLVDVAKIFIKAGADVHKVVTFRGDNCFHFARSRPMVKFLASHGVDINLRNRFQSTPLHVLAGYCNVLPHMRIDDETYYENTTLGISAVKKMIKCGADVNAIDVFKVGVIEMVTCIGSPKAVLYMIQRDVEVFWEKLFPLRMLDEFSIKLLARNYFLGNVIAGDIFRVPLTPRLRYLRDYMYECIEEIEVMKEEKINCNYTIYHYMVEIAPKIKPLRSCPHYELNDDLCEAMFPIYNKMISARLNTCYRRAGMLDVLENINVRVATAEGKAVVSLINDCKFALAACLSNEDLYNFLIAMGMKESKNSTSPKGMNCTPPPPPLLFCELFCRIIPIS